MKNLQTEANRLKSLWVPNDFPCRPLSVKMMAGQMICCDCGQPLVVLGHSYYHPDTPALKAALDNGKTP